MMIPGFEISVQISGSLGHGCVATRFIHGTVANVGLKAVKIELKQGSIWLPKKALEHVEGRRTTWYKLSKWFRPSDSQWRTIEANDSTSGISTV